MRQTRRLALYAGVFASFGGSALALALTPPADQREHVWAQTYSDLPPDPGVRFGVLANGMRYAIQKNATPRDQVSLRLRIGSGSLEESADEQGLAHVLEHMAFRGSAHVPDGEMVKQLERHGLAFGADTNAQTGFTETVYQLDLPQAGGGSLDLGLTLMRDVAGELTLSAKSLEPERGVVLSEERLRDSPSYEAMKARLAFELKGQLAADRLPIGKVEVIRTAPAALVRRFYEANYRPDRATLVVTGDIDPDDVEREIKGRFGGWAPVGPPTAEPKLGTPARRGASTQLVVRRGVAPSIQVVWASPFDDAPDTAAREVRDLIRTLALTALDHRLARMAQAADAPFLSASASHSALYRSADLTALSLSFKPGAWRPALDAAISAQRQALQYGFTAQELARVVAEYRETFRAAAAAASTRRTPALADELVRSADEQGVDTAPDEDLRLFEQAAHGLTVADLDTALRRAFTGQGPLVSMVAPDAPDGGEGALASAFNAAETRPVSGPAAGRALSWSHSDFGAPGRVAQRREVADLGVTFVRFANGVRLTIKPTAFQKDTVGVVVHFGHGRMAEARDRTNLNWAASAFVAGGLRDLSYEDIQQVLADRSVSVAFGVEDDAFALSGATRPQDLDLQLQLLAAYVTAPGWRPEAFERTRSMMGVLLSQLPSTPAGVQAMELPRLEHDGDRRWALATPEEVRAASLSQLRAVVDPALAAGEIEVEIVGDVAVDAAVRQVARTFGALPARATDPAPAGADQVRFPAGTATPVRLRHHGRPDQAQAYVAWPATDLLSDPQRARRINMAAQVLELRLIDKVRIAEGATYSPAASASESDVFPGYGKVYAAVEIPPARLDGFYADVDQITADLRENGITADELQRAIKPRIETIEKAQQTNGYWLAMLHGADADPRRLDLVRGSVPGYARMTAADVQAAARAYLTGATAWRLEVMPTAPASDTATGAALPAPRVRTTPDATPRKPKPPR